MSTVSMLSSVVHELSPLAEHCWSAGLPCKMVLSVFII